MPEETRKGVEDIKRGEIDKRKKIWEDKEGPPTKKQKKMTAAQEERGNVPLSWLIPGANDCNSESISRCS
jgi:hypothetical protein